MHDVVVVVAVVKGQVDTIPWFNGLMVTETTGFFHFIIFRTLSEFSK